MRLLPKGGGVPTASRLQPITLLACDYKFLTKMMVARLVKVLQDVLKATQECSVEGRSIFNGATAVLLAAEYLKQRKLPGFVASLDFFHAYDRVSLRWVDCVLEAMGFGEELRGWVATCHRGAEAAFMLEELSPFMDILFSLRQGDPLAMILFMIQLEPLLARWSRCWKGWQLARWWRNLWAMWMM